MRVDIGDLKVRESKEPEYEYTGRTTVEIHTATQAEALQALQDATDALERLGEGSDLPIVMDGAESDTDGPNVDPAELPDDVGVSLAGNPNPKDEYEHEGEDGESDRPGVGSPYDDSEVDVRERVDGIIEVETPNGYTTALHTGSRTYQVLYHMAHYWYSDGGGSFTTRELDERYDHLEYASIGPCIATLRRAELIAPLEQIEGGGHTYRLTDEGEAYVQDHGEPTSYRLPE